MSIIGMEASINPSGPNPQFVLRARRLGRVAAYVAISFALTIPLSWLLQFPILRSDLPTLTTAHVLGACFSMMLGLSILLLYRHSFVWLAKAIWWIILVSAGIVLFDYLVPGRLPFAGLVQVLDPIENPDKIAPNGALCLFLSSLSALLISSPMFASRSDRTLRLAQAVALFSALVASLALIGHAYTIESLYGISHYSAMSVPGALTYFFLAVALVCVWPDRGMMRILVTQGAAGVMSRRLYTAAVLVPPILGFLALVTSGLWKWYDISFAIVLLVVASILLFATVVAITSRRIERVDAFRFRAEEDLRASRERLRELSAHMQVVQEEERVRIAREVHDELGQSLTALKMDVALLRKQLPESKNIAVPSSIDRRMKSMLELVNGTIRSVQRISSELRPSVLDDLGLAAAIEWQAREFETRSGVPCLVELPSNDLGTNASQATAIFRIFQETLTNIARHASAGHVEVQLREAAGDIQLRVHDDGVGFDDRGFTKGQSLGLMGMRERAALAGGTLDMESTPGAGMTVTVTMPSLTIS